MAKKRMTLLELLHKAGTDKDLDFLREGIKVLAEVIMELEVSGEAGAVIHERNPDRNTYRNGYRNRIWDTRAGTVRLSIPRLREGSYFPSLLEPRRRIEHALSPEAKGKVERPYRWLQDRIVRTCAIEKLTAIGEVRAVLKDEVNRYNNHQVHSTTGEVPSIRFEKANREGNSLFRPFALSSPYTSTKDVFCLREMRTVNGYRKISFFNHEVVVPNVLLQEEVEVHLVPGVVREALEVRIWWDNRMVQSITYPLKEFPRVHF